MKVIDFKTLTTLNSIALNFGINITHLEKLIESPDNSILYETLHIPKKNPKTTGNRTVYKANDVLADLHKNILTSIKHHLVQNRHNQFIHECAHGYVNNKTTYSNAVEHLNKKYLLQVDIQSFFKTIPIDRIVGVFQKLGCTDDIAILMTKICSINDLIEEGLHTSPMLANLYFFEIDEKLLLLANKYGCDYTRYADDMTFSSDRDLKETDLLQKITEIIESEGLHLSSRKTRYSKYGQAQYVTGLSISNSKRPRIPKKMKRQLRQEFHYIKLYGFLAHFEARNESAERGYKRINGWLDYIMSVEPELGIELKITYQTLKK
ncbi:reverse transcriptase family protein [Sulfuricurvum sp.]|uniref:reverse transcriptase family protein n=1 Tax=Sulfuricurvum sp. TaxID=2025608 RepID=UPI003BB04B8C